MANITIATVKVFVTDEDEDLCLPINFDDPKYAGLRDAINALSYDGEGFYENGLFNLSGRWNLGNNFNFLKERILLWEEFTKVRESDDHVLCFDYIDYDCGMDWIGHFTTLFTGENIWDTKSDGSQSFADVAREFKIKRPRGDNEDKWDQFYDKLNQVMVKAWVTQEAA